MSGEEKKQYGLNETDSYDLDEIKARIEKRNQEKAERKRRAARKRITVLAITVALIGLIIFSFSNFFVVDHISVEGNRHFSDEEIINIAHASPGANLIYHPGKADIVSYLEQNPYIKKASVARGLPSTLIIKVEERRELGALKYDDDFLIIDNSGILLKKTQTQPKLTLIEGIVVSKIKLGEKVGAEDEELMSQTLELLDLTREKDLYFVKINVAEMYIKAYIYDSFICKGTYRQLRDGIGKGRLHKVLEKLFDEGIRRGTITFSDEGYASFVPSI
ncbi:MAG: FtsQ-type POTRA domain-containing protein [Mogibacterium sp.]|nr:FtsQ-type POTRA domain-containing protein [Mogibacterium sp.]